MHDRYSLILAGGEWNARTAISRALSDEGWRVSPVDTYDEVDAALIGRAILTCLIEHEDDIRRLTARMGADGIWLPFIVCTRKDDRSLVASAYRAGAVGHLDWPFSTGELSRLIEQAEPYMRSTVIRQNARADARRRLSSLTGRERDVLEAMVSQGSNKLIAARLGLSPRTVEVYRARIMQRLAVKHMAHAIWIAFQSDEFAPAPEGEIIGAGTESSILEKKKSPAFK